MLFTSIEALRGKVKSVGLAVAFVGTDQISLIVTPQVDEAIAKSSPGAAASFVLTGTAAELDAEFADQFQGFEINRVSLAAQTQTQIETARKAKPVTQTNVVKPLTTAAKTEGSAQLSQLLAQGTPVDSDDDKGSDTTPTADGSEKTGASSTESAAEPVSALTLFGDA